LNLEVDLQTAPFE